MALHFQYWKGSVEIHLQKIIKTILFEESFGLFFKFVFFPDHIAEPWFKAFYFK